MESRPPTRLQFKRLAVGLFLALALTRTGMLAAGPDSLTYVDSSSGLEVPGFEGGDTEFEMGDLNGDGHIDLISVGDHGNPRINTDEEGIMVWFGDGLGTWTYDHYGYLGYGGVALGDVNDDGLIDVGYGIHHDYSSTDLGDQLLEVALGDGTGTFWTPWDDGLAPPEHGQSWGLFSTDFGDVDADGDLDVGSIGFGSMDGMHVYLNQGDGTWLRAFGFLGGNSNHVFVFGDVNGDGHLDVAAAKARNTVWMGDGEGFLLEADGNLPPLSEFDWRDGPDLGDVNGDGRDDLSYCDDSGNARVWLWQGSDTWQDVSSGIPQTGTCQHTQLYDMDGDGLIDLSTFGDRNVHVFGGDGTGVSWTLLSHFTTPESPGWSACFRVGGDVDHNGMPDMVLVNEKEISWFEDQNIIRVYREASIPDALNVRIVRPGPNRTLLAGAVTFIDWASEVPTGTSTVVHIDFSGDGIDGPWTRIASSLPSNGRYQWKVARTLTSDARLRVTVTTGTEEVSAISPTPISIVRRHDALGITFSDKHTLLVEDGLERDFWNVYRSDWQRFLSTGEYTQDPAAEAQAAHFCDTNTGSLVDTFVPAAGTLVFYLATGYRTMDDGVEPDTPMSEGLLGQDSATFVRRHDCPCPTSP